MKKLLFFLFFVLSITPPCLAAGALVLPVYVGKKGIRKVFISKEDVEGSPFYKLYEGWGGSFDSSKDKDELDTAAREFWEEAILHKTLGWSFEQTKAYLQSSALETIIKTSGIEVTEINKVIKDPIFTYIVRFEKSEIKRLKKKFFAARDTYRINGKLPEWKTPNCEFCEKGDLATIPWDVLVQKIQAKDKSIIAKVQDSSGEKREEVIALRAVFLGALHKHFVQHPEVLADRQVHSYEYK